MSAMPREPQGIDPREVANDLRGMARFYRAEGLPWQGDLMDLAAKVIEAQDRALVERSA